MGSVGWKSRLVIVLSAIWLVIVGLQAYDYDDLSILLLWGVLPVGLLWGCWWVLVGFFRERGSPSFHRPNLAGPITRLKSSMFAVAFNWRLIALYIVVFVISMAVADFLVKGRAAFFLGEALVYSLIALLVFLVWRKTRPHTATLTVAFLCGAIVFSAYQYRDEEQELISLGKRVAPIMSQLQTGVIPTDDEVRQARLMKFEPVMLAVARYSRSVLLAAQNYEQTVKSVGPLLSAELLGTESGRARLSMKVKQFETGLSVFESEVESQTIAFKNQLVSLSAQLDHQTRAAFEQGLMKGALVQQEQFRLFFDNQKAILNNLQKIEALVNRFKPLPGSNSGGDVVRFSNPFAAEQFNQFVKDGFTLARKEQEIRSGIQTSNSTALENFLGGLAAQEAKR